MAFLVKRQSASTPPPSSDPLVNAMTGDAAQIEPIAESDATSSAAPGSPGALAPSSTVTPAAQPQPKNPAPARPLPPLPARMDFALPVPNILVVGESGHGKTHSLQDLNWASGEIAFIDTEVKGFSWQRKIPEGCYFPCRNPEDAIAVMTHVEANPKFKLGVVDSFTGYNLKSHEVCKKNHTGYEIYAQLTTAAKLILEKCKSTRVRWILTAIPEMLTTESEGNTLGVVIKRAKVVGRECEGTVESYFAYAVFLKVVASAGTKPQHFYILQTDGKTTAKIPEGVTTETQIENSMAKLLTIIEKAEKK